jgi:hypothetical protein
VLGKALDADPESPLGRALADTVEFLRSKLLVDGSQDARRDARPRPAG